MKKIFFIVAFLLIAAQVNAGEIFSEESVSIKNENMMNLIAEPKSVLHLQENELKKINDITKNQEQTKKSETEEIQKLIKETTERIKADEQPIASSDYDKKILTKKEKKQYEAKVKKIHEEEEKLKEQEEKLQAELSQKRAELEQKKSELAKKHSIADSVSKKEEKLLKQSQELIKNTETKNNTIKQTNIEVLSFPVSKKEASIYKRQIKNSGLKYNEETFVKLAEANKTAAVKAFLYAGMKPDTATNSKTTPLIWACFNGNYDMVKVLIQAGANVNHLNKDGFSPLHAAVENGNPQIVRYLLQSGAKINTETFIDRTTPLHTACYKGNMDIVQILVVAGANVNAKDKNGVTPIVTASFYGKKAITDYLSLNGAKIDAKTQEGKKFTEAVIKNNKTEAFETLVKAGTDINSKDSDGKTMLIAAVEKSDLAMVSELIKQGADVNVTYKSEKNENMTALHSAVCKQNLDIVKLLVKSGADINAKNSPNAITPLQIAVLEGNEDIVAILSYNGADINAVNAFGFTAADIALAKKDEAMLKKLVSNGALFSKKTGGILASYGCSVDFDAEKGLFSIKASNAIKAVKNFESIENEDYKSYMQNTESFRENREFTLDEHAFKIYPFLFEFIK